MDTPAPAKILILEDDIAVAEDLRLKVEQLGYSIVGVVSDAAHALILAQSRRPDLALVDIVIWMVFRLPSASNPWAYR
jgi:CheY-like chemotaxis protein